MRASLALLSLFAIVLADSGSSYKILVYNSKFGHSHSAFLGRIADILVEAGHNVTSLIPIVDASLADGTEKSRVIHVQADPAVAAMYANPAQASRFGISMFDPRIPFLIGRRFAATFEPTCRRVVDEPGLIERLRAEKYDVYITENFDVCGIGIAAAINPKAVIGSTTTCLFGWHFDEFGLEAALSYRPTMFSSSLDVHSISSRFWNLIGELMIRLAHGFSRTAVNRVLKGTFGEDYPTVAEQSANVAYVLTNSESLIETAAPTSARVIDIPGIGSKTPKPLDEHWESILNRRAKAVLLSFGTMARSTLLSAASKEGILQAFAQFPDVTFIWKYEEPGDEFCRDHASKLGNIVITKWMPQVDILKHYSLALFITHGGMGSMQETALRGVPGIFIPIFGDQPRNAGMMQSNGLGLVYDKFELSDGIKLAAAIREVLENEKYADNAKRISKMLAKKPFSSREKLIKHVEFAAEFGPSSALRPQSVDMTLAEYYNIDIIIVFSLLVVCSFVMAWKFIAWAIITGLRKQKQE